MALDDVSSDRQAQTGPAAPDPGPVGPVEALEHPIDGTSRDPDPVILDGHHDIGVLHLDPDRDLAAVGAELDRVMDEVDQDLAKALLGTHHCGRVGGPRDDQPDRLALGVQAQPVGRVAGQSGKVNALEQEKWAARFDPGQVEQLAGHLDEVVRLDFDLADPIAHSSGDLVTGRFGLPNERLGQQADIRERRP